MTKARQLIPRQPVQCSPMLHAATEGRKHWFVDGEMRSWFWIAGKAKALAPDLKEATIRMRLQRQGKNYTLAKLLRPVNAGNSADSKKRYQQSHDEVQAVARALDERERQLKLSESDKSSKGE